ncbi:hypothetical protein HAX54_049564 [Datura stramonium]|uniref:Ubiquitin-like domain-containing protein n=1 Tax=Datura stramonium TaxID=4076 RepID=A0ABS8WNC5_DATST|nr:hypothetical protein [Datura stramonium]
MDHFICVAAPFLYDKLPEEPLKLTILKLDGSSFDIEVLQSRSVEDLKRAVVEPSAVQDFMKLLSDDDLIGTYGIKDGDELSFVRHVSVGYNPEKKQSEGEAHQFDESRVFKDFDDKELKGEEEDNDHQDESKNDEDGISEDENNGGILGSCQYSCTILSMTFKERWKAEQ